MIFILWHFLCISTAHSALFIFSNKELDVTPLQKFDDEDFQKLVETMYEPHVVTFKTVSSSLDPQLQEKLVGLFRYSAYSPNGHITGENDTIELDGTPEVDASIISDAISKGKTQNLLGLILIPQRRFRRDIDNTTITTTSISTTTEYDAGVSKAAEDRGKGPVMYKGQSSSDETYTLLYSSERLLLIVNETSYTLGATHSDMITVDYRLNVNIPWENGGKITLRFNFTRNNAYWSLGSVKISSIRDKWNFQLNATKTIEAPNRFSYHCSGDTVFTDSTGNVGLYLYNMQVQIGGKIARFSDAIDCVSFTTAPILSGIFVTAILAIGMYIGLVAMMDIKTMDKFDDYRTKQLTITISE